MNEHNGYVNFKYEKDGITYDCNVLFGHVEIESYFKFEGGKMIGMGRSKTFDRNGVLLSVKDEPTGLEVSYG